jgi:hypothetical protein
VTLADGRVVMSRIVSRTSCEADHRRVLVRRIVLRGG